MYGIQRLLKNQRSIQCIDDGDEEVRNLDSSVHRYGTNLNVLRFSIVKTIQFIYNLLFVGL